MSSNSWNQQNRDDVLRFSLQKHGLDFELGRFFRLIEMASKDGTDLVLVHPALILVLNDIREHFDTPVTINSGYRSPSHNARIGGATESRHLWGMAADLHVWGVDPEEVGKYAESKGIGGLKAYNTFTHVDVQGLERRW